MKKRSDSFTDAALRTALEDYLADYAATLPTQEELNELSFSAEFEEKMERLTHRQKQVYYYWINTAFKKAVCVLAAVLLVVAPITVGVGAFRSPHEYLPATCTLPMQCTHCDKTAGEPLGHIWIPATCTTPMHCSVCGETEGETLPHTYSDATCTTPRTCTDCGATEGEPLPHTFETVGRTEPSCTKTGTLTEECTVCGEQRVTTLAKIPHAEENIPLCSDVVKCKRCGKVLFTVTPIHHFFGGRCTNCGAIDPNPQLRYPLASGHSITDGPASPFGDKGSPGIDDSFPSIPWDSNATPNHPFWNTPWP